ncbi:MAG: IS110 family transposase [Dehalococcoidia bacterium]
MQVIHERCAGLDVHKKTVVACVITPQKQEIRTFPTMTQDLLQLADWLTDQEVTHVAMESTGSYWKPIYNLLEDLDFTLLVVNAQHMKAVPGRKTDVKDAEWIADLLHHGLLKPSYIPDRDQRELRELVRYRRSLIQERARVIHRIQKVLEGANIKLDSVMSDITGVSGRAMLQALSEGTEDPAELAALAKGRLRSKIPDLKVAAQGLMGPHQRMMLGIQLQHLDFLAHQIEQLDQEVVKRMQLQEEAIECIDGIPGIGRRTAEEVLAEIGPDMSRFPTAGHLASWARLCPGHNESAGKRKNSSTGRGNPWLRSALVEGAWVAARTKDTHFSTKYRRLAARRGKKRAIIALAHMILKIVYHLLQDKTEYRELGSNHPDQRNSLRVVRTAARRIEDLGYKVTIEVA